MLRTGMLALAALLVAGGAKAQDNYPSQTVKIVIPSAPGSTTDILARLTADQLGRKWGKPVMVENIAGGSMNIGAAMVARAAPDGYTLFVAPPAPIALSASAVRRTSTTIRSTGCRSRCWRRSPTCFRSATACRSTRSRS